MRILNIINELSLDGGAEILVKDLVSGMNQRGVKSDIMILKGKDRSPVKELIFKGINVISTGLENIYSFSQVLRINKIINNYDIIHAHLFPCQYWCIFSKVLKNSRGKFVTTEHSTSNRRRSNPVFKNIERYIYSKYDKIICISQGTKASLVEWIPSIDSKTIVIENGIDIHKFSTCKPYERSILIPGLKDNSKLVLMVARMGPQKDYKTLISAIRLLPQEFHAILVGEGQQLEELKRMSCDLNIADRVHFLGVRNDVNRIMKSVDLFVLSSNWEGFGLAAVEAMASGLPVIASDVQGLSDIVKGYGVLFTKGDAQELSNIIKKISFNNEYYADVAEKCKQRANDFSIDRVIDNYIQVYNSLIGS